MHSKFRYISNLVQKSVSAYYDGAHGFTRDMLGREPTANEVQITRNRATPTNDRNVFSVEMLCHLLENSNPVDIKDSLEALCQLAGFTAVKLPEGEFTQKELLAHVAVISGKDGKVAGTVLSAYCPDSEGGSDVVLNELNDIERALRDSINANMAALKTVEILKESARR